MAGLVIRMIEYQNEIAKTDAFKFTPSVGIRTISLSSTPGSNQYCIIPCTSEPKEGNFNLTVFASGDNFTLDEINKSWNCVVSKKANWKGKTAGGSPNYDTFINNPQYLLTISSKKKAEMLVDLVVSDEYEPIGFLMIKQDNDIKPKRFINKDQIKTEEIVCQPEGWVSRMSIGAYATILDNDAENCHFIIIPSTFKPDVSKTFELSVYSDEEIKLEKLGDEGIDNGKEESSDSESESESEEEKKLDYSN